MSARLYRPDGDGPAPRGYDALDAQAAAGRHARRAEQRWIVRHAYWVGAALAALAVLLYFVLGLGSSDADAATLAKFRAGVSTRTITFDGSSRVTASATFVPGRRHAITLGSHASAAGTCIDGYTVELWRFDSKGRHKKVGASQIEHCSGLATWGPEAAGRIYWVVIRIAAPTAGPYAVAGAVSWAP